MKMFSWLLVAMLVFASWVSAQTNEVTSVNVVGYYKATLYPSGKWHQVSIQLDPFDPTLQGVFGTNQLRGSTSGTRADQVWIWKNGSYETYAFHSGSNCWSVPSPLNGLVWGQPTNPPLSAGDTCFIYTPKSGPYANLTNTITIMGEVIAVPTSLVDVAMSGYAMMGYPFSSDVTIDKLDVKNDGAFSTNTATRCDQIWLMNPETGVYTVFGLRGNPGETKEWREISPNYKWTTGPAASNTIALGQAFWYSRSTYANPAAFTWSETNVYLHNLR